MTNALPVAFCLHALGGSARQWNGVTALLPAGPRILAIDLPGFGEAVDSPADNTDVMVDAVIASIKAVAAPCWMLVGASMGGKIAMAVARRAEDGETGLAGLAGLVMLAGSPPCPEPMDETKRSDMLAWIDADDDTRARKAAAFVDENVGATLPDRVRTTAVEDVLRSSPRAWTQWLETGSREDWRARIGVLSSPALVLSGGEDPALGPDAQDRLTIPHLATSRHLILPGARHLLALERPTEVAAALKAFVQAQAEP